MTVNEAVMNCAKKIRRAAGVYQADGNLKAARRSVDLALNELGHRNRNRPDLQIGNWGQLRLSLESHFNTCSDSRWLTVIKYARAKASARRAGAVKKLKTKE